MYANYHTHTDRCGHAVGGDEEYVKAAIDAGYKILGISDHGPCRFPDGAESGYRVQISRLDDYFASFKNLREKYADKIDIHIGFELEYYPLHYESMLERIRNTECEYLILGQHAIYNERPDFNMTGLPHDSADDLRRYVFEVCEALYTGSFSYVCHPEIFNFKGPEEQYLEIMRPIITTAKETGTPLEINFLGIRDHRNYPMESFWKMVSEERADVIFGTDAHTPGDVFDAYSLEIAEGWVKKYDFHLLNELEFRKP